MRDRIVNFVQMIPFGDFKVVLLDEADYLSSMHKLGTTRCNGGISTTSRFILTCNYPKQNYSAIHSVIQGHIAKIDQTEFTARVAEIPITEEVNPDLDILDTYVKAIIPIYVNVLIWCK